MKKIKINLETITPFELNLAKNERVIALSKKIITWPPRERARRVEEIQQKIQQGEASLFEERVLVKLLEQDTAERIQVIAQNITAIERELQRRAPQSSASSQGPPPASSQQAPARPSTSPPPASAAPAQTSRSSPASNTVPTGEFPSELLDFLATQTPPTPRNQSASSSRRLRDVPPEEEKSAADYLKEIILLCLLVVGLGVGFWFGWAADEPEPIPLTFNRQVQGSAENSEATEALTQQIREEFDAATQELRFGNFEQGHQQLLALIDTYPQSLQTEEAYMILGDTFRHQRNDPDTALHYYQTYLERFPEHRYTGLALLKSGYTYEDLQDWANARQMYTQVLERYGESSRLGQLATERLRDLDS